MTRPATPKQGGRRKQTAASHALVHTDFDGAFTKGFVFESETEDVPVRHQQVARLVVISGKILAADPSSIDGQDNFELEPFARRVRPGKYPVLVSFADFGSYERPACMMVRFKRTRPVRWELAVRRSEDLGSLKPDQVFGYGVDAGIGCFVDASALRKLARKTDWFYDVYMERFLSAYEKGRGKGMWGEIVLDPRTGANLVACNSGGGDGFYASYWGLGPKGEPVCLVTDFGLFLDSIADEAVVDLFPAKGGGELVHPKLSEADLKVRLLSGRVGAKALSVEIKGHRTCTVALIRGSEMQHEAVATEHQYQDVGHGDVVWAHQDAR